MKTPIAIIVCLALASCLPLDPNEEVDEGKVHGNTYTSQEIGWSMEIPSGYTIYSKEQMDQNYERGKEAFDDMGVSYDARGLKHLISFHKDRFNGFRSTSEPFELSYEGEWEESGAALKEVLHTTFTNQGIALDTASSKARVGGLEFDVFHITLYGPEGQAIMNLEMYSCWINGYDFAVNINYNNPEDEEIITRAWMRSKFAKADG